MLKKLIEKEILVLSLILVIASALMLTVSFKDPYPVVDEATHIYAMDSLDRNIFIPMRPDAEGEVPFVTKPSFTIYLGFIFTKIFGYSIYSLRILMTFIGILTIIASYIFAKKLFDKQTAMLTALFLSLSTIFISNVSIYMTRVPLGLFLLIFSIFLLDYLKKGKPKYLYASALFLGFALGTDLFATLFLLPVLIIFYYFKKIQIRPLHIDKKIIIAVIPLLIGLVIAFPQILNPLYLYESLREQFGHALVLGNVSNPGSSFLGTASSLMPIYYYFVAMIFKMQFLFPFFVISFYGLYKGNKYDKILLILMLIPFLGLSALKVKMIRYIIFLLPFMFLAISRTIIKYKETSKKIIVFLVFAFLLLRAYELYDVHPNYELSGYYAGMSFSDIGEFRCQNHLEADAYQSDLNGTVVSASYCKFSSDIEYLEGDIAELKPDYIITDTVYRNMPVNAQVLSYIENNCNILKTFSVKGPFYFIYEC